YRGPPHDLLSFPTRRSSDLHPDAGLGDAAPASSARPARGPPDAGGPRRTPRRPLSSTVRRHGRTAAHSHSLNPRFGADRPTSPAACSTDSNRCGDAVTQWAKCRTPVKYIVIPAASAAATTSASRTEPPGCTTARTPPSTSTSSPSGNGKNASEAATDPAA